MTVCIAAMCGRDEEPLVVVAADRLMTAGGFMEFEHPGSKIVELTETSLVMVAGDTNEGMRLARGAAGSAAPETIPEMAEDLGNRYFEARARRTDQYILRARGLDPANYYAMHGTLNGQFVMLVDQALMEFDLGVELLLAGVDDTGAHIHTNRNPGGGNTDHGAIGWAAIGSGAVHVMPSMAGFEHGTDDTYGQTLFRVYASKRRAEVAPGVGHETDVAVVGRDGIKRLTDTELQQLDSIYEEFVSKTNQELENQLDGFDPDGGDDDDGSDGS